MEFLESNNKWNKINYLSNQNYILLIWSLRSDKYMGMNSNLGFSVVIVQIFKTTTITYGCECVVLGEMKK